MIHLTVGACIVREDKVLLLYHSKLNKWLFPGGHVEENETLDEAVVREVREETGLNFEFLQYSSLNKEAEELTRNAVPFHANSHNVGDHDHYCAYYLGTSSSSNFVINHESKAIKWFSLEDLNALENAPKSILNMARYALETVKKQ